MKTTYTTKYYLHSLPSTFAGIVAAVAAIALLTRDAQHTGLTLEHAMMPVLVFLTVLFGHEAFRALKEWKLISAVGFVALAIFGSGIIVAETMGRRAETRDAKVAQATKTVDQYATVAADYQRASKLVAESEKWAASECATGKGKKCDGQTFILNQRKAHADALRLKLEQATAPAPVDSKADKIAYWAALFGASKATAKEVFQNFDPFSLSLFLELGAVFAFGFGIRTRKVAVPVSNAVSNTVPAETPQALSFEREDGEYTDEEIEEIRKILTGLNKTVCNSELAKLAGVDPSEMSKRWRKAEKAGIITAKRSGKYMHLSLVA
jgi:hypothetical protein